MGGPLGSTAGICSPLPHLDNVVLDLNLCVADMLIPNSFIWNEALVRELFRAEDVAAILQLQCHACFIEDHFIWTPKPKGHVSTKFAFQLISGREPSSPHPCSNLWNCLWGLHL